MTCDDMIEPRAMNQDNGHQYHAAEAQDLDRYLDRNSRLDHFHENEH
jgi:hypothetical protein